MSMMEKFRAWLSQPIRPEPPAAPPAPAPEPPVASERPRVRAETVIVGTDLVVRHDRLKPQLILHEGNKAKRYKDTEGKWTIGIGRNLDAKGFNPRERAVIGPRDLDTVGLTAGEIDMLYRNDVAEAIELLDRHLHWWRGQDEVRRRVLVDMMFNMGPGNTERGLLSFRNTLQHIRDGRYDQAAEGMKASKWARQTKTRADRLIEMMKTGQDWRE
jgi:lysozyme